MDHYYDRSHLPRFGEIAEGSQKLADSFFSYYNEVFEEGALTVREKALIALGCQHRSVSLLYRCLYNSVFGIWI